MGNPPAEWLADKLHRLCDDAQDVTAYLPAGVRFIGGLDA